MKTAQLRKIIKEEIKNIITEESYIDVYSFDKILPKKSRYNFKQSVNIIVDTLEENGIPDVEIKKYMIELMQETFKLPSSQIFNDY